MTISEQIEKLEEKYGIEKIISTPHDKKQIAIACDILDAMQIIRAITAPPTETEIEAVVKVLLSGGLFDSRRTRDVATAAISAFLKGRGV